MPDDDNLFNEALSLAKSATDGVQDSITHAIDSFTQGWETISNIIGEAIDMNMTPPDVPSSQTGGGLQQGVISMGPSPGPASDAFTMEPDSMRGLLTAVEVFYDDLHHRVLPDLAWVQWAVDARGWEGTAQMAKAHLRDAQTKLSQIEEKLYQSKEELHSRIESSRELMHAPNLPLQPASAPSSTGNSSGAGWHVVQTLHIANPQPLSNPGSQVPPRPIQVLHVQTTPAPAQGGSRSVSNKPVHDLAPADPNSFDPHIGCVAYATARWPGLRVTDASIPGAADYIPYYAAKGRILRLTGNETDLRDAVRVGDAVVWDRHHDYPGSINLPRGSAGWENGHVAIIEEVGADYAVVSQGGWPGRPRMRIPISELKELYIVQ